MAEIYQLPENGGSNNGGFNGIPFSIPIGNFGMGMNNGGWGNGFGNGLEGIITLAIVASLFGWGNGGFGGGGFGGGNGAAGFLANQMNNDSGRELLMNAITSQGEASRAATQNLATMLGQDFNLVNGAVMNVQNALQTLALQQAVSVPQIINSIQSGDSSLSRQLCECCCENRLLTTEQGYQAQLRTVEQTNALQNSINAVNDNITNTRAAQQLSDCQQTYALTDTMNRNFLALDNKIDQLESNRKDREITALTAKVATLESQNFTTGIIGQAMAPVNAQLGALAREVDDIKCKMPETVSVQYPNLQVYNATPYVSGGIYPNGYFGNGWNNGWNGFFGGNGFGGNIVF